MNNGQARYTSDIVVVATDNAGQSGNATVRFNFISNVIAGMMPPGATVQTTSQFQNALYDIGVPSYRNNINNVCSPRRAAPAPPPSPFPHFYTASRRSFSTTTDF